MTDNLENLTISTAALADLFGLTTARLGQLVAAGVLVKRGRGHYDLMASVKGYVAYARDAGSASGLDYRAERTRLVKLQADAVEHDLELARGVTVSIQAAVAPFSEACSLIRTQCLSLASRCAPLVAGQDERSAYKILQNAVVEILTALSTDLDVKAKAEAAKEGAL